jgi:hypothetical protein
VLEDVPWKYVLAAQVFGVCWVSGAVVGLSAALVRMWVEKRHG